LKQQALLSDPATESYEITSVEVEHGVVTLSGIVGNLKAKKAAEEDR